MSAITCYDANGNPLQRLYQWDTNQALVVSGLTTSPAPVFHFCNRTSTEALVVVPTVSGNNLVVNVPNILLQQPETLVAYVYEENVTDGYRTIHAIRLPVIPRPKPSDYVYEENIDYISVEMLALRITELLQEATEMSGAAVALEVVDMRVGYDGTVYDTAGDALRAQEAQIDELFRLIAATGAIEDITEQFEAQSGTAEYFAANLTDVGAYYFQASAESIWYVNVYNSGTDRFNVATNYKGESAIQYTWIDGALCGQTVIDFTNDNPKTKIFGLINPTEDDQAANKGYVDSLVGGVLPTIQSGDNGKIISVVSGAYALVTPDSVWTDGNEVSY